MRCDVKAKLAGAFTVVIVLSTIVGAVRYFRSSDRLNINLALASRLERIAKAAELEKLILLRVRAEKNALLAQEPDGFVAGIKTLRGQTLQIKDEIRGVATETGKKLIDDFKSAYGAINASQDQSLRMAKTDRLKAIGDSTKEVRKVVAGTTEALTERAAVKPQEKPVRATKAAGAGGFAFDMNDGENDRDADFGAERSRDKSAHIGGPNFVCCCVTA